MYINHTNQIMLYSFYYIDLPNFVHFNPDECPFTQYMQKYGFMEYLPIAKPKYLYNKTYLLCFPTIICEELLFGLSQNGFFISYLSTDELDIINFENTIVDETTIWKGCSFETKYFVKNK